MALDLSASDSFVLVNGQDKLACAWMVALWQAYIIPKRSKQGCLNWMIFDLFKEWKTQYPLIARFVRWNITGRFSSHNVESASTGISPLWQCQSWPWTQRAGGHRLGRSTNFHFNPVATTLANELKVSMPTASDYGGTVNFWEPWPNRILWGCQLQQW